MQNTQQKTAGKHATKLALILAASTVVPQVQAMSFTEALTSGKTTGQFRLRYESVEQDNAKDDASALTLRSRLAYQTKAYNNWSAKVEFEDSRVVLAQDEYNNTNGKNTAYSVIADPEVTELEQAFIAYKNAGFNFKLGRQVLVYDNHRFVGHVGWRQDRQTFDAAKFTYKLESGLSLDYAHIYQRNRIFGEQKDIKSKDHLINISYPTSAGKLTFYRYLLEQDNGTDNELDTFGLRFAGKQKVSSFNLLYQLELAQQDNTNGSNSFDTEYMLASIGAAQKGYKFSLNYEVLGSDDGQAGFATPLATLHKFNGWSDQFLGTPAQGLVDLSLHFSAKLGGGKLVVQWHDFSADQSTSSIDDLGSEIDIAYSRKIAKGLSAGVKLASYSAGDDAANKVDTDKAWLWLAYNF